MIKVVIIIILKSHLEINPGEDLDQSRRRPGSIRVDLIFLSIKMMSFQIKLFLYKKVIWF